MKKETIKELGKYLLDISKIFIALVLVAPFMKLGDISNIAIFITIGLSIAGLYFTNKGAKDE